MYFTVAFAFAADAPSLLSNSSTVRSQYLGSPMQAAATNGNGYLSGHTDGFNLHDAPPAVSYPAYNGRGEGAGGSPARFGGASGSGGHVSAQPPSFSYSSYMPSGSAAQPQPVPAPGYKDSSGRSNPSHSQAASGYSGPSVSDYYAFSGGAASGPGAVPMPGSSTPYGC
jgi:hypothetical protein